LRLFSALVTSGVGEDGLDDFVVMGDIVSEVVIVGGGVVVGDVDCGFVDSLLATISDLMELATTSATDLVCFSACW